MIQIMEQDIRWKQRFANFERALLFLQAGCSQKKWTQLEEAGVVQAFEFSFELAWKTLKDYLYQKGIHSQFPRDVIKDAFQSEIIEDGTTWLKMLDKRNELSHTYNKEQAEKALHIIKDLYYPCINQLYLFLKKEI